MPTAAAHLVRTAAFRTAAAGAVAALGSAATAGAQVIDTRPGGGVSDAFSTLGPSIPGQTFTVPVGANSLLNFGFWIGQFAEVGGPYAYRTRIYAWDGSRPVGPALYTSDLRTAPLGAPTTAAFEQTFVTGGVSVTPGSVYIALLHTELPRAWTLGRRSTDVYAGGLAYTAPWQADPAAPFPPANPPSGYFPLNPAGVDLVFFAQFAGAQTVIPEPTMVALVGVGLVLLGGRAVGRRGERG